MKNPIQYQGNNKTHRYFEGWYFKVVNQSTKRVFAVILGVSKDENDPHSFIQINDNFGYTEYYKFELEDFKFIKGNRLKLNIKNNYFSEDNINLDLPNLKANLTFSNSIKYKGLWPNIMGPFSFIPLMQCYHGVVIINSNINGSVIYNNETIDYSGGKGYIEKDWGIGFPDAWIWLQGNSFKENDVSIMMSLAHIPWLGSYFPGFLGFINLGNKTHYFSTYNNSKVSKISVKEYVELEIKKRNYLLKIRAKQNISGVLKSPVNGSMKNSIKESVNSVIEVELYKNRILLYKGITEAGGLEVVGGIESLFS